MKTKKLIGKKCYLSPVDFDDVSKYYEWINSPDTSIFLTLFDAVITHQQERSWLEAICKPESNNRVFAIVDLATDNLIGNCGLHNIDLINRNAEFGIFIGEKSFLNKGYGEDAAKLILDFGFNALNLHNIWLRTYSFNKKAQKVFARIGFKEMGRKREVKILGDRKFDEIIMDILSTEFKGDSLTKIIEEKTRNTD
jgi:RimJ/RimL family protein N-acetyltransferase